MRKALTQAAITRLQPGEFIADAHVPGLRLIAYTAARPGEVTAMLWRDIDLAAKTWVIRERKRDHSHVVHLNAQAIAILSRRKPDDDPKQPSVFPSDRRRGRPMRQHALVWSTHLEPGPDKGSTRQFQSHLSGRNSLPNDPKPTYILFESSLSTVHESP